MTENSNIKKKYLQNKKIKNTNKPKKSKNKTKNIIKTKKQRNLFDKDEIIKLIQFSFC